MAESNPIAANLLQVCAFLNADRLHFTAEGYRQFGKRYAEKMLSLLGYKVDETKLPITPIIEAVNAICKDNVGKEYDQRPKRIRT